MSDPRTPPRLGQYDLVRPIGSGGMGVVFEAVHRSLGRRVAVKMLHSREATSDALGARFLREGRAAALVRHAHVVDVFDYGVDGGVPYLVMELLEGETLAQRLARGGPLTLPVLAELMLPVVSAVAELHAAGIVHRDLKPSNILLAKDRAGQTCPKVADFGVSRMIDDAPDVTDSRAVLGTYPYMAPEQCRASRDATERSDLYALGVILYECATGQTPFAARSHYDLLHAIMTAEVTPPSAHVATLPPAFDALVLRALERDPDDRFACAEELGEALLAFAAPSVSTRWEGEFRPPTSSSVGSSMRPVTSSRMNAVPGRRWRRPTMLSAAALAFLALAGWSVWQRWVCSLPSSNAAASAGYAAGTLHPETDLASSAIAPAVNPSAVTPASSTLLPPTASVRPIATATLPPARARSAPRPASPADNGAPILDPR